MQMTGSVQDLLIGVSEDVLKLPLNIGTTK